MKCMTFWENNMTFCMIHTIVCMIRTIVSIVRTLYSTDHGGPPPACQRSNVSISPKPWQASEHIRGSALEGKKRRHGHVKKYLEGNTIMSHLTQLFYKTVAGCRLMVTRGTWFIMNFHKKFIKPGFKSYQCSLVISQFRRQFIVILQGLSQGRSYMKILWGAKLLNIIE